MKFKIGDEVKAISRGLPAMHKEGIYVNEYMQKHIDEGKTLIVDGYYTNVKFRAKTTGDGSNDFEWLWHEGDFILYKKSSEGNYPDSEYHLATGIWNREPCVLFYGTGISKDNRWFLIQDNSIGAEPEETEWRNYGKYSWAMELSWRPTLRDGYPKITDIQLRTNSKITMHSSGVLEKSKPLMNNLISKFKKLTRTEPDKSFIAQGVTDEQGGLTSEGRDAFTQFLFEAGDNKKAFYDAVIKPIVDAETKK